AEGHFEVVNTPATVVPGSNSASSTSVRPLYRMPASAVAMRTPAIAGMSGTSVGARGETVVDMGLPGGGLATIFAYLRGMPGTSTNKKCPAVAGHSCRVGFATVAYFFSAGAAGASAFGSSTL